MSTSDYDSKVYRLSTLIDVVDMLKNANASFGAVLQAQQDRDEIARQLRQHALTHAFMTLSEFRVTREDRLEAALRNILDNATFDYKNDKTRAVIAEAARLFKPNTAKAAILGAPYGLGKTVRQVIQEE